MGSKDRRASIVAFSDSDESTNVDGDRSLLGRAVVIVATGLGLFHYWSSWSGGFPFVHQRAIHLGGALAVLLIGLAAHAHAEGKRAERAYTLIALGASTSFFVFVFYNTELVIEKSVGVPLLLVIWAAVVMVIGLDLARRVLGWMLPSLVAAAALIVLFAGTVSGPWRTWIAPVGAYDMGNTLGWSTHGIFGSITGISAGIVASFLVFGAMLGVSGGSTSFLGMARFFVGRYRGGPGKVSILTSAFFGTVSGSAVANVVVDGVFNIPLMKRSGFKPSFAAAVEATTSTGGQLVPPIMGAAAFILADFLGLPFTTVILAAIVPCLLYYAGLFIAIHLEAAKQGIPGMPKSELPRVREFVTAEFFGSFAVPMVTLVVVLFVFDRSLLFASFCGTTAIVVYMLGSSRESVRARLRRVMYGFQRGGEDVARIASMVLAAQILISVLGMSAAAARLANQLARFDIPTTLSLVFLMVVIVLLGFGVPTAAAYVLAASIVNPIFVALEIDLLAGHLFALYIAVYANITPPIMPATYAAAAIARADLMRSGIMGARLLVPALLVPFSFAVEPSILLSHGTILESLYGSLRMLIGMGAIAVGLGRWLGRPLSLWNSVMFVLGGAMLAFPGLQSTVIGLVLMLVAAVPLFVARRAAAVEAAPPQGAGIVSVGADGTVEEIRGEDWGAFVARMRSVLHHTDIPGLKLGLRPGRILCFAGPISRATLVGVIAAEELGVTVALLPSGTSTDDRSVDLLRQHGEVGVAVGLKEDVELWRRSGVAVATPSELEIVATTRTPEDGVPASRAEFALVASGREGLTVRCLRLDGLSRSDWASRGRSLGLGLVDRVYLGAHPADPIAFMAMRGTLAVGAVVVVAEEEPERPQDVLDLLASADATVVVAPREDLLQLAAAASADGRKPLARLGSVVCTDGPMAPEERELVASTLGVVVTEVFAPFPIAGTVVAGDELVDRPGTVGRPWTPEASAVVLGVDGSTLKKGEGEVAFHVPRGLELVEWLPDGSTQTVTEDHLLRTSLRGRIDDEGFLYLAEDSVSRPPLPAALPSEV